MNLQVVLLNLQNRLNHGLKITVTQALETLKLPVQDINREKFFSQLEQIRLLINITEDSNNIAHDDFMKIVFEILQDKSINWLTEETEHNLNQSLQQLLK